VTSVTQMSLPPHAGPLLDPAEREAMIWRRVDDLLAAAAVDGVLANKLGPIAARRLHEQGRPVPPALENEARLARAAWMSSIMLLSRIRSVCEGPLLLIKGPEVAALYPGRARAFMDVDILSPQAQSVHAALRANGFIEVDDPELFTHHHHLRPLQWPALWLKVEVHQRPMWPKGLTPPSVDEIVAAAVPSATGVPGLSAPDPAGHALILAGHGWVHEPLDTLRDLIDVAAVAARADPARLMALARAWGIERIWRTTYSAANGLVGDGAPTRAVRLWGRHLPAVKERTVLGNHLARSLHSFWALPPRSALRAAARALRFDLFPYDDESWREKLIRVGYAFARPSASRSSHTQAWRAAAQGRQEESLPEPQRRRLGGPAGGGTRPSAPGQRGAQSLDLPDDVGRGQGDQAHVGQAADRKNHDEP
jgi:hypothetical protein